MDSSGISGCTDVCLFFFVCSLSIFIALLTPDLWISHALGLNILQHVAATLFILSSAAPPLCFSLSFLTFSLFGVFFKVYRTKAVKSARFVICDFELYNEKLMIP